MDISPYEAIVVGSGATGGIAALTLAEQGIKVLVIEAGPQVKRIIKKVKIINLIYCGIYFYKILTS